MFILIASSLVCDTGQVYNSLQHVGEAAYCVSESSCRNGIIFTTKDTNERYCGNCINGADTTHENMCSDIFRSAAYVFDLDEVVTIEQCESGIVGRKQINGGAVRYCATCMVYPSSDIAAINDTQFDCSTGCGSIDEKPSGSN